jgi:hypothetical protein
VNEVRQLLLARKEGPPTFGLVPTEPAAEIFLGALAAAEVPSPGTLPAPDVTVPAAVVPGVVEDVRTAVRDRRSATPTDAGAGAYDAVDVQVLGETVRLRIRDPRHHVLKRLAALHDALESLAEPGADVFVLTLPDFDDLDRAILHTVRDRAPSRSGLAAEIRRHLAELEAVAPAPETTAQLRSAAARVGDAALLDSHLARLRDWGLLQDDGTDGTGAVNATEKLRRIRF